MGSLLSTSKNKFSRNGGPGSQVSLTFYDSDDFDFPWVWAIRNVSVLDWKNGLTNDEIDEQHRCRKDLPVHIYGKVFLGSAASVENIPKLQELGITRVLNLAGPMAVKRATIRAYERNSITYKGIPAQDDEDYPFLAMHWDDIHKFIHENDDLDPAGNVPGKDTRTPRERDGNCVVHCVAGINRSVLAVTADYMITCEQPVLDAVKHVRQQRGNVALSNPYFQEQLVALARRQDLLGHRPGTPGSAVPDVFVPTTPESIMSSKLNPSSSEIPVAIPRPLISLDDDLS
jgi:hypothetical protein